MPKMQFSDFEISGEFHCGGKHWRCTDLGQRVVVAILIDKHDDPSWRMGHHMRSSKPYLMSTMLRDVIPSSEGLIYETGEA